MDKNVVGIVDTVKDSSLVNRKSPSFIRWCRIIRVELKALKNGVFKLWKVTLSSRIICKRSWNSHFIIKVGQIKKSKLCEVRFHDVWKSQKKSHSILRAKNCPFGEFLKTWSFGQTVLPDRTKIGGKMPKFKNSNGTFWVIFKQRGFVSYKKIIFLSKYRVVLKIACMQYVSATQSRGRCRPFRFESRK